MTAEEGTKLTQSASQDLKEDNVVLVFEANGTEITCDTVDSIDVRLCDLADAGLLDQWETIPPTGTSGYVGPDVFRESSTRW